jgi:hypothetical protein
MSKRWLVVARSWKGRHIIATEFNIGRPESNRSNLSFKTIRDRLGTVAATLLVVLAAFAVWRFYLDWRLGRVELTTDGPPLTVQVLPETDDEPLDKPFDMAGRAVVSLPAGDYRLRVNARGRVGRTYRFAVNQGETQTHSLSLEEARLLGGEWNTPLGNQERPLDQAIPFTPSTDALELTPGRADFIEWTDKSLVRRDGVKGAVVWDALRPFTDTTSQSAKRPATFVDGSGSNLVAVVEGTRWLGLNPASGQPLGGPIDLDFIPVRPVQHADFDGDGESEVLALGPGATGKQQTLAVFSIKTGQALWTKTIGAPYQPLSDLADPPDWPLVIDLDGDGRREIVVPDAGPLLPVGGYRGVRMLDGASGRTRWVRPMRPDTKADDRLTHVIEAPDLDGDGTRDLVTISRFDGRQPSVSSQSNATEPERIYVDALSGNDGHRLWWWHADIVE